MLNSPFVTAVRSLHFQLDRRAELQTIDASAWPALLKLTDRSQITLPLGIRCREFLPELVRHRIERNLKDNGARHERLFAEYQLIAKTLKAESIEFVVLKGLSQIAPFYIGEPRYRPQYDIDLYCPPEFLEPASDAMMRAGFEPIHPRSKRTDHLPAMLRTRDFKWRGDYYDLDLPLSVELHFRFWDEETERLPASGVEYFWHRRTSCVIRGCEIPTLSLTDGVSYSALHLVRHLLRGDLRVYHAYELAHFLHQTDQEDDFWSEWLEDRSGTPPLIEAVAFRLAVEWFGCKLHPIVTKAVADVPLKVARWFALFAESPLALEQPNKDELFLHLALAENHRDRYKIVARRLFPLRPPTTVSPMPANGKRSLRDRLHASVRQAGVIARRALHHLRTTVPLVRSFFRWKMLSRKYATP